MTHLVDKEVLPLLEGLPTLVADVVPHFWKTRAGEHGLTSEPGAQSPRGPGRDRRAPDLAYT